MNLRPSEIFYSQDSISNTFGNYTMHSGLKIGETLDQLLNGYCSLKSIPQISVVFTYGKYFTTNNRRLWVFRKAEELGFLDTIEVNLTSYISTRKFTTLNGGTSIRVRGDTGGISWKTWKPQESITDTGSRNGYERIILPVGTCQRTNTRTNNSVTKFSDLHDLEYENNSSSHYTSFMRSTSPISPLVPSADVNGSNRYLNKRHNISRRNSTYSCSDPVISSHRLESIPTIPEQETFPLNAYKTNFKRQNPVSVGKYNVSDEQYLFRQKSFDITETKSQHSNSFYQQPIRITSTDSEQSKKSSTELRELSGNISSTRGIRISQSQHLQQPVRTATYGNDQITNSLTQFHEMSADTSRADGVYRSPTRYLQRPVGNISPRGEHILSSSTVHNKTSPDASTIVRVHISPRSFSQQRISVINTDRKLGSSISRRLREASIDTIPGGAQNSQTPSHQQQVTASSTNRKQRLRSSTRNHDMQTDDPLSKISADTTIMGQAHRRKTSSFPHSITTSSGGDHINSTSTRNHEMSIVDTTTLGVHNYKTRPRHLQISTQNTIRESSYEGLPPLREISADTTRTGKEHRRKTSSFEEPTTAGLGGEHSNSRSTRNHEMTIDDTTNLGVHNYKTRPRQLQISTPDTDKKPS